MRGGAAVLSSKILGIVNSIRGLLQSAKDKVSSTDKEVGLVPFYVMVITFLVIVGVIALYSWYLDLRSRFETPDNIRAFTDTYRKDADKDGCITQAMVNRKSLLSYLQVLKEKDPNSAQYLAFANFYISTVNASGLFYPRVDGIVSPDAARLATQAGARAFVFDIWPDLRPGANFAPIIQVVESPSLWRRTTLNFFSFNEILNTIIRNIYLPSGSGPAMANVGKDCVVLYLRFRGTPRQETYTGVAASLRDIIEPYRLDSSFYARTGEDRLFLTSITDLFSKVIVMSNDAATGTPLEDYVNYLQRGPNATTREWTPQTISNLTEAMKTEYRGTFQKSLTVASPLPETDEAAFNSWDWTAAQALGIQYAGVNFFYRSDKLKDYLSADNFGVYSYKMKPDNLRLNPFNVPTPGQPANYNIGNGTPNRQLPIVSL